MTDNILYDAIIVPGGGMQSDGNVPQWVAPRLELAAKLHNEGKSRYIIVLSGGTIHKAPPLDQDGFPVFESEAAARYLKGLGIDPHHILCEIASYDTIGNAFFARMIHLEPRGFQRLLVITSEFHMQRTAAIFQWVLGLSSSMGQKRFDLHFQAVPNVDKGIDEEAKKVRKEKEYRGYQRILKLKEKIQTLEDFHVWLYSRHGAYAASVEPVRLKGPILNTY